MTKEQYEEPDGSQFLTQKEKRREDSLNRKNKYAMDSKMLRNLARKHKAAGKAGDYTTMARIEYRLDQIGMQEESGILHKGEYAAFENCAEIEKHALKHKQIGREVNPPHPSRSAAMDGASGNGCKGDTRLS